MIELESQQIISFKLLSINISYYELKYEKSRLKSRSMSQCDLYSAFAPMSPSSIEKYSTPLVYCRLKRSKALRRIALMNDSNNRHAIILYTHNTRAADGKSALDPSAI